MQRSILLISSSSVAGSGYFDPFEETIKDFLQDITEIVFVPYAAAKNNWENYTKKVKDRFSLFGIGVTGINKVQNNLENFKAIFVGGGNSFRLLHHLQQFELLSKINEAVLNKGMRYIGSSAGSNVACRSIRTTNDMPILYPAKGFDAINLVPIQVNPHYIDPDPNSTHMGETRDDRIKEFHEENDTPVIGLREGAYLKIDDEYYHSQQMYLGGTNGAKFFFREKEPVNITEPGIIIISDTHIEPVIHR